GVSLRTSFSRFRNIALHSALPATSEKRHGIGSNSGRVGDRFAFLIREGLIALLQSFPDAVFG
ncbi:MAG: hypothetical protein ABFS45_01925, partial [Pseudomonadota bacterium]